jgi:polar amino acid transport system substrate-binding protein
VTYRKPTPFIRQIPARAKALATILLIFLGILAPGCIMAPALAQSSPSQGVFIPKLFDPNNRLVAPNPGEVKPIRFLTADDYPPFEFIGADGSLVGYNVDVARAICEELKVSCTIQPRRWDNLLDALTAKDGDAIIASMKETPAAKKKARFTAPYYLTPARFVILAGSKKPDAEPEGLRGMTIGVLAQSAHEAFLRAFFTRSKIETFPNRWALMEALRAKKIDLAFGDAISLAVWMNGRQAENCCVFVGGPYLEPEYFGHGVGIAVRPEDDALRKALNWALERLEERGVLTELYLKYFPIGIY